MDAVSYERIMRNDIRKVLIIRHFNDNANVRSIHLPSQVNVVALYIRLDARNGQAAVVIYCEGDRVDMHVSTRIVVARSSHIEAEGDILTCVIREIHIYHRSFRGSNLCIIVITRASAVPLNLTVSLEGLTAILANIYAEDAVSERT